MGYAYDPGRAQTELISAAYHGDAGEIERLLELPCDIDAQDVHGASALMYAAMRGHEAAVRVLVENGAALELQSAQRFTALTYAVRGEHLPVVQTLLRAGADPDVNGDYEIIDTPLTLAAWQGSFAIVRMLVAAGATVGIHAGYAQLTAECIARRKGHHEISEFLCYHEKRP